MATLRKSTRSVLVRSRLCVVLNQLFVKALLTRISIVSSKGTFVNNEETSYETKISNYDKKELEDLSIKVQTTVQPVFVSRKIEQDLKLRETKPQIVNQQRVIYHFQCDLCDAGYVGYTRGHLHTRVDGHKQKASSVYKHYHEQHGEVPKDLLRRFSILKKCRNKLDCLVNEMLFIRDLKPTLNVQNDSIRAKVFI